MSELVSVPITELMERTEKWLLEHGYKKSTLGCYKATWNRFRTFSGSPNYDRKEAEKFLLQLFGVDVNAIDQKLDMRMRHARRHMNALDEYLRKGQICRRKVRGLSLIKDDRFDHFFSDYLDYCKTQHYSRSWMDNTTSGLKLFLLAAHSSGTTNVSDINTVTINCFAEAISTADGICMNVRRTRCRQVGLYLKWLYNHRMTDRDYSLQLPNFKATVSKLPHIWKSEDIEKILSVIDTASPVGKRNYAMFLLIARMGLRISDVVGLKLSDIDWRKNCISFSQKKTGNNLSLPLSKEVGMAIVSYLRDGRPPSTADVVFVGHNAPFAPLAKHNNFNSELHSYLRRAGIEIPKEKHTGTHTLRHSFASNMLKSGTTVQEISQILGHSSISSTETYLRVDLDQLRMCSLNCEVLI